MTGPGKGRGDERWHRARDFTVPPRQAEAEAEAGGRPLPIGLPDPAGLPRHRWSLATALLWIVWRDEGRVAAELPRLVFWGERMRHEVEGAQAVPLDMACRELGDALAALPGLAASGVRSGGEGSGAIPPDGWPGLMFGPLGEDKAVLAGWGEPRWEAVRVSAEAVRREWPVLTVVDAAPTDGAPAPGSTQPAKASGVERVTKEKAVADALLTRFPKRPAGVSGPEMLRAIEGVVGFVITDGTSKRALKLTRDAWSRPDRTGSNEV